MFSQAFDHTPAWLVAIPAFALTLLAFRFLGARGALAVAALSLLGLSYKKGREVGRQSQVNADARATTAAVQRQKEISDATHKLSDRELDKTNAPWVRQ